MSAAKVIEGTRTGAVITEQLIHSGACILYGITPELVTTGTITIRDGAAADGSGTIMHVCAIGLPQAGKQFSGGAAGIRFNKGLTVQLSVATDLSMIVWEAAP